MKYYLIAGEVRAICMLQFDGSFEKGGPAG